MKRHELLARLAAVPAVGAGILGAMRAAEAAKSSQAAMKYQNHPHGNQKCAGCRFFIKGKTATANGTCQIVAGSISPNGWCIAYAPK